MNFNEDYTIHESSFEIDATFTLYDSLFCPDAVFIILFLYYWEQDGKTKFVQRVRLAVLL